MHSLSKCRRVHVFREVILKKQLEAGSMTVALHFFDNTLNLFMTSGVTFNVVIGPAASRKSSKARRGSRNSFPQLFPSFRFNNRYEVSGAAKISELFHGPEASQLVVLSGRRLVRGVASIITKVVRNVRTFLDISGSFRLVSNFTELKGEP